MTVLCGADAYATAEFVDVTASQDIALSESVTRLIARSVLAAGRCEEGATLSARCREAMVDFNMLSRIC
jgi:hypothetical protein